jgi:protein SFI1
MEREGGEERLDVRFKRALAELEIHVDVEEDGEDVEETGDVGVGQGSVRNGGRGGRERSGSFNSFFDGSADKIPGTADGPLEPPRERRGSHGADRWPKGRSASDTEAQTYSHARLPLRPRANGHDRRAISEQQKPSHRRGASVSSRGSLRIRRNLPTVTSQYDQEENDAYDSEHTAPTANITDEINLSNVQIPGINVPIPDPWHPQTHAQSYQPEPYRPSDTRLMDDAETFEQQRLHSLARACLQKWRERLRERNERDAEMNRIAAAFDGRILMKGLLGDLKVAAQNKRNNSETEHFFGRLERRAEKARSLFLLTKAFTHWARSAEDEVQRTSVARRHILRTRFFKGWRDITAVNELKIQQFTLRRFLDKWRRRAAERAMQNELASETYDNNLLRRYHKHWFFQYCNIAAPAWHNVRLKRTTFERWREIATVLRERDNWAMDWREREIARKTLAVWRQKIGSVQELRPRAVDLRRRAMLKTALSSLQKQAQFAPLLAQHRNTADVRLVRSIFQTWSRSAQLSHQARTVEHLRILRNAWTAWNDRLRIKALEERINDRVLVETMYKWTLASRVSLFQRVHSQNLKESVFHIWLTRTNNRRNTLDSAERRFAYFKRTQTLRSCLRKIESATAEKRAEEFAVKAEYEQKIKRRVFDKLLDRHEHLQQLDTWAGDAQFYVLTKGMLKRWSEATQSARRNRRRESYAQVRRTVKLNLVRRALAAWKTKADHIHGPTQQADAIARTRTLEDSRVLLKRWNERTSTLLASSQQASQAYNAHLQTRHLNILSERLHILQAMDAQALALRQESTEIAATSAFKKLGWRLWNVQRQQETAIALHQRNFEKHVKAMLRFWWEQTVERVAQRPGSPSPTGRSRGGRDDDDDDEGADDEADETRRLEAWTAFDEGALGLDSNLDLSLSISPQPQPPPPPFSSRPAISSIRRPQTYPQPQSALRPRPPPIPEDIAFEDTEAFWTSTPMPPHTQNTQPARANNNNDIDTSFIPPPTTTGKPGYLKTPSKRSVARSKRPELPPPSSFLGAGLGSPERRGLGVRSAPPVPIAREMAGLGNGRGGVTSFERRLRMGGYRGAGAAGASGSKKTRVEFDSMVRDVG